ncbi:MAG: Uma2 family endonuclease [Desulfococcaceae bacterium]
MTPAEYLEFERTSETKHEYFDGEVFAMAGAKPNHNLINANLISELRNRMVADESTCRVYPSDQRIKIEAIEKYTYPDISIACENIEFEDDSIPSLLNPVVIIEILSESTEAYDRGKKFTHYRLIPSLREYLLVSQDHCQVETYMRSEVGRWIYSSSESLENKIKIESIDCDLSLSEIYRWIEFEDGDSIGR